MQLSIYSLKGYSKTGMFIFFAIAVISLFLGDLYRLIAIPFNVYTLFASFGFICLAIYLATKQLQRDKQKPFNILRGEGKFDFNAGSVFLFGMLDLNGNPFMLKFLDFIFSPYTRVLSKDHYSYKPGQQGVVFNHFYTHPLSDESFYATHYVLLGNTLFYILFTIFFYLIFFYSLRAIYMSSLHNTPQNKREQ